ncbi:alkylated DNA repair protein ALKBH8 homolog isoform X3 [Arachis stenosperma]|uniref:alkylated DNA repair protein ALKBH8 homolog isoform X3 n=1 Tax=Arachis stenosperma TaxID=217475 RepID=UPI0025AD568A|nr:alkylated DNA repair protein ALKBH8 homolog isoform X3 [Arachis stenosperma]
MGLPRFGRPKNGVELSPNLYVANCGPAVGISHDDIASVFCKFGELKGVYAADESGTRVIVSFSEEGSAQSAFKALDGTPCPELGGRSLHIRYSVIQPTPKDEVSDMVPVSINASELSIPGLYLVHNFISAKEEEELLQAVDSRPWNSLSKRRVQHYGYEFRYDIRNVNTRHCLGPCIMEFRKYENGDWHTKVASSAVSEGGSPEDDSNFLRKAIYLPPRSLLLLSGEARYAWNHYIPHHKIDKVNGRVIRRASRRVSFTFRKMFILLMKCGFTRTDRYYITI